MVYLNKKTCSPVWKNLHAQLQEILENILSSTSLYVNTNHYNSDDTFDEFYCESHKLNNVILYI